MVHFHSLLFPSLVRQGETTFRSWSSDLQDKTTTVYKLDWTKLDELKKEQFLDKAPCSDTRFPGTLPESYDTWIKSLQFTIPTHYLDEIRRCTRMALIEWNTERRFDTMIREICLIPAEAYAYVAFRLLADCLYDPDTNYFYRKEDKIIVPQALLYKFWAFQTGRGLIKDHARFEKITCMLNLPENTGAPQETVKAVRDFTEAIKDYEEKLEEMYSFSLKDSH